MDLSSRSSVFPRPPSVSVSSHRAESAQPVNVTVTCVEKSNWSDSSDSIEMIEDNFKKFGKDRSIPPFTIFKDLETSSTSFLSKEKLSADGLLKLSSTGDRKSIDEDSDDDDCLVIDYKHESDNDTYPKSSQQSTERKSMYEYEDLDDCIVIDYKHGPYPSPKFPVNVNVIGFEHGKNVISHEVQTPALAHEIKSEDKCVPSVVNLSPLEKLRLRCAELNSLLSLTPNKKFGSHKTSDNVADRIPECSGTSKLFPRPLFQNQSGNNKECEAERNANKSKAISVASDHRTQDQKVKEIEIRTKVCHKQRLREYYKFCSVCNKEFKSILDGVEHFNIRHRQKRCPVCLICFPSIGNEFNNHVRTHFHESETKGVYERITCRFCEEHQHYHYKTMWKHIADKHLEPTDVIPSHPTTSLKPSLSSSTQTSNLPQNGLDLLKPIKPVENVSSEQENQIITQQQINEMIPYFIKNPNQPWSHTVEEVAAKLDIKKDRVENWFTSTRLLFESENPPLWTLDKEGVPKLICKVLPNGMLLLRKQLRKPVTIKKASSSSEDYSDSDTSSSGTDKVKKTRGRKKLYKRFTKEEIDVMLPYFLQDPNPSWIKRAKEVASIYKIKMRRVYNWFNYARKIFFKPEGSTYPWWALNEEGVLKFIVTILPHNKLEIQKKPSSNAEVTENKPTHIESENCQIKSEDQKMPVTAFQIGRGTKRYGTPRRKLYYQAPKERFCPYPYRNSYRGRGSYHYGYKNKEWSSQASYTSKKYYRYPNPNWESQNYGYKDASWDNNQNYGYKGATWNNQSYGYKGTSWENPNYSYKGANWDNQNYSYKGASWDNQNYSYKGGIWNNQNHGCKGGIWSNERSSSEQINPDGNHNLSERNHETMSQDQMNSGRKDTIAGTSSSRTSLERSDRQESTSGDYNEREAKISLLNSDELKIVFEESKLYIDRLQKRFYSHKSERQFDVIEQTKRLCPLMEKQTAFRDYQRQCIDEFLEDERCYRNSYVKKNNFKIDIARHWAPILVYATRFKMSVEETVKDFIQANKEMESPIIEFPNLSTVQKIFGSR